MSIYRLWRQDDNGNRFLVDTFKERTSAEERRHELQRGFHKQMYWISEEAENGE